MTIDLGLGKSITDNAFRGRVWVQVEAHGGGITVALTPEEAAEFGLSVWRKARKLMREQPKVPLTSIP